MKKNIKNLLIIILLTVFLYLIIKNNLQIKINIIKTAKIFITQVFPSLFPMFILSSILINYGFVDLISFLLQKPFSLLFKINPHTSYIFIMSLLTGSPSNAKYSMDLLNKKYINLQEAKRILCFSYFTNPIFIINTTFPIFHDIKIVLKIIISVYLANIFIGLLLRKFDQKNIIKPISFEETLVNINNKVKKFNDIFSEIIFKGIKTMILIFSTMIIFSCISTIISCYITNDIIKTIISGLLEISNGLNNLKIINTSIFFKELISILFLSFSGICIIFQIKSIIKNISIKEFVISRFLHVLISTIIFIIII